MKPTRAMVVVAMGWMLGLAWCAQAVTVDAGLHPSAVAAVQRGADYLRSRQLPDGSWVQHPAITALACTALHNSPLGKSADVVAAVDRGLGFIRRHAHEDGSIWNKEAEQYPNYSTSICLIALAVCNRPEDQARMRKAREFLFGLQSVEGGAKDPSYGGIGYGKKLRPDLSNTQWALEALYVTDHLDREPLSTDPKKAEKADLAWDRAIAFLSRCQNLAGSNDQAWVVSDPANRGGFVYMPDESKAGETEVDGKTGLRSYGSMTYAGLKSMIYAKVKKDDPRVKAAMEWVLRHFTFSENPGMGAAGHYYYLHTCAKALAAYGEDTLTDASGKPRNWRAELIRQYLDTQKPDGSWVNSDGRWFETMPELVTCYSVLALQAALPAAPAQP